MKKHENNISVSDQTGFDYRPFSLFNFPGAAILDFMTVAQLFHTKELLLTNNCGNRNASQNPKWRLPGNLKAKIVDNRIFYF